MKNSTNEPLVEYLNFVVGKGGKLPFTGWEAHFFDIYSI
jgi:hypothetical protein